MRYTRPDIIYYVNLISSHDYAPSASAFQGINKFIRYLDGFPQNPIRYISGFDSTTPHDLCQEVYPGKFHSQKRSNGLVAFADGVEYRSPNDKRSIACIIICIFGADVNW